MIAQHRAVRHGCLCEVELTESLERCVGQAQLILVGLTPLALELELGVRLDLLGICIVLTDQLAEPSAIAIHDDLSLGVVEPGLMGHAHKPLNHPVVRLHALWRGVVDLVAARVLWTPELAVNSVPIVSGGRFTWERNLVRADHGLCMDKALRQAANILDG